MVQVLEVLLEANRKHKLKLLDATNKQLQTALMLAAERDDAQVCNTDRRGATEVQQICNTCS
jgi:hypothetical protein